MAYKEITGIEEASSSKKVTQVYEATHVGEKYLPYMNRSFISFSFGGKRIEDFNLIAYTDGDRLSRQGSSNFNNLTSNSEVLNGQLYWGTFFEGNTLELNLATDGITQRQLDDFLRWFRGGETRELILAEHPNRGILARVAEPPSLSLLPFEETASITLQSYGEYTTSTTLYRGEITLSFQMDDPFWYSIDNVFGYYDTTNRIYHNVWNDANNMPIDVFDASKNKDVIKIMLEDGIPISNMIQSNMLMGNNLVAIVGQDGGAVVADDSFKLVCTRTENEDFKVEQYKVLYTTESGAVFSTEASYTIVFDEGLSSLGTYQQDFIKQFNTTDVAELYSRINELIGLSANNEYVTDIWNDTAPNHIISDGVNINRIQGVLMLEQDGVSLPKNYYEWNFYYSGTAPAYPILEFELTPVFNATTLYISTPSNRFDRQPEFDNSIKYNTFTVESENKYEFKFTTPNIYTSYNTAAQIFMASEENERLVDDIYPLIRENVKHYAVRAWAMRILDQLKDNGGGGQVTFSNAESACGLLQKLFKDENDSTYPAQFHFDSKTGIATGTFTIRDIESGFPNSSESKEITDNVGDMVKSDWLVIKDRNYPTADNLIRAWSDSTLNENGKLFSHRFYHDVDGGLNHVRIIYNNMYL